MLLCDTKEKKLLKRHQSSWLPPHFCQVAAVAPEPQATLSNCNGDPQWQELANERLALFLCQEWQLYSNPFFIKDIGNCNEL